MYLKITSGQNSTGGVFHVDHGWGVSRGPPTGGVFHVDHPRVGCFTWTTGGVFHVDHGWGVSRGPRVGCFT